MSYDIIYFAAAVTWIQLGGNEQLFAFSPREAAVVQEGSRAVTHAAAQLRTIVKPDPDLEKGTSAAASEQFLIQAQKKATRKSPFSLPANGISWFYRCNMFLCRVLARSRSRHTMTRNDLCHLKRLHLLRNDRNL